MSKKPTNETEAFKLAKEALTERMAVWRTAVKRSRRSDARTWELTVMGLMLAHMLEGEERLLAEYAAAMLRIVELEDKLASLEQQEVAA